MQPQTFPAPQPPPQAPVAEFFARMIDLGKGAPKTITINLLKATQPFGRKSFKVTEGIVPIDPQDAPLLADIHEDGEPTYRGGRGRLLFQVFDAQTAYAVAQREMQQKMLASTGSVGALGELGRSLGISGDPAAMFGSAGGYLSSPAYPPPAPPPPPQAMAYQPPPGFQLVPIGQPSGVAPHVPQVQPTVAPVPAAQPVVAQAAPVQSEQVFAPSTAAPTASPQGTVGASGAVTAPVQKLGRRKGGKAPAQGAGG